MGGNIDWGYSSEYLSVEDMWGELYFKLNDIASNAPKVKIKVTSNGKLITKDPWDCTALKRKRRESDAFWAKFDECPTSYNLNIALCKQSELDKKLSQSMIRYEKKITNNMKSNPKAFLST